jgi:murein DD-endopeptidase MepM/ murein hydrolase activator NlpD
MCVSSREDNGRYRGRRRAPTPPRSRYAVVVTTAFVGAGIVALGAANSIHEPKTDPAAHSAAVNGSVADRAAAADRANRNDPRVTLLDSNQVANDLWMLPLQNYTLSTPFSLDKSALHPGLDLAAKSGTPYYATHAGTVKLARFYGGYGYTVMLDLGDGTTILYGHSSKIFVSEGQQVLAGEALGLVGDTGYAFGDALYFEVQVKGKPVEPKAFLLQRGVDIANSTQPVDN